MQYFHIFIHATVKGKDMTGIEFNMKEEYVERKIAKPYMNNKSFVFCGKVVNPSDIERISIFRSEEIYQSLVLPNGKSPIDEENWLYKLSCFSQKKVKGIFVVTRFFITSPPRETKQKAIKPCVKGKKVFIVHGRDETQALRLQKYLTKMEIDAEMFEDFKERTASTTIIELLEYIQENVGYAFVVATPDDLGVLREDEEKLENELVKGKEKIEVEKVCKMLEILKTRARQNVVFEHGLFIAALGRDGVCCLLQKDVEEKPSDIDGILYVGFEKSVTEKFSEIEQKLKNLKTQ